MSPTSICVPCAAAAAAEQAATRSAETQNRAASTVRIGLNLTVEPRTQAASCVFLIDLVEEFEGGAVENRDVFVSCFWRLETVQMKFCVFFASTQQRCSGLKKNKKLFACLPFVNHHAVYSKLGSFFEA